MAKITPAEFYSFRMAYYNGAWTALRLGQAFINKYYPASGEESSDVFYERDSIKAESIILARYVDLSE